MDFTVGLGEIRESLVSWSGLDWVAGVQAAVPCGRGGIHGAGPGGSMRTGARPPSHIFPTVSPVPARDRARHRTGKHMMTEVSRGRQAVSLELGSPPRGAFYSPHPPQGPTPALLALRCWPRPCPCFLGARQPSPAPSPCGRGGRASSCCSAGPRSHWKPSWGLKPDRAGPGAPGALLLGTEPVRGGGGGASGSRNSKVEEPLTSNTKPHIP